MILKSGERGIFSRYAAHNVIERSNAFRKQHFDGHKAIRYRDPEHEWGCNPCSEIILRDKQFCNLSEVVVRPTDSVDTLKRKVRIAAIFGTFQSTLTDFKFIAKKWRDNTEEERLLGVSLTGIMDNKLTSGQMGEDILKDALTEMRKMVIHTNLELSGKTWYSSVGGVNLHQAIRHGVVVGRFGIRYSWPSLAILSSHGAVG